MHFQPRLPVLAAIAALALPSAAFAETITVTDIAVTGPDGLTITIPTIEAVDANLDEAGIRALFTDYAGAIGSLETLTAASITIPIVTVAYQVPGMDTAGKSEVVYHDFSVTDVVDGTANGGARLGSIEIKGPGQQTFSIGEMSASFLDIGGIIAFYGLGAEVGATDELTPIYKDFTLAGMTFGDGAMSCTIGAGTASEFSARPLKHSFTELMTVGQEMEAAEKAGTEPTSEQIARALSIYVDVLTAFRSTPSTLDGLDCKGADEKGNPIAVTAGTFTIGGFEPGIYPDFSLDAFRVDVTGDGWLEFGNLTWKKMDLTGPIAALKEAGAAIDVAWFEANWRKLIPAIEGFSVTDFALDVPDEQKPGARVAAEIGAFDVTLGDYVNGIPSTIATSGSDVSVVVPNDEEGAALRALGFETLNLGFDLQLDWNEADNTIAINNVALSATDLGAISLRGIVGNAGPELFSENLDVATAASMGLTVKELTIDLDNAGVAQLLIAAASAEQKVPPEAMHAQFMAMARALPIAILGASQEAIGLGDALGTFLAGAPQITITLTAVDPNGIGLAEFMAAGENPALLQGKFTVAATASGEPVPFVFPEIAAPADDGQAAPAPTEPAPVEEQPAEPAPRGDTSRSSKR